MAVNTFDVRPECYISGGPRGHEMQDVPEAFWCKIEAVYPNGRLLVLLWPYRVDDHHVSRYLHRVQTKTPATSRIVFTLTTGEIVELPNPRQEADR